MANASSSAIDRVGGSRVLFQNGTESWIAQQIMLDRDEYAFCGTKCPLDHDGGLVQQLKQTGSCGTPANGIVTRDLPKVGVVLEHRNSAENDCGNATMKSLWRVPIRRGAWVGSCSTCAGPPTRAPATSRPGSTAGRCSPRSRALEARHARGRRGPHPHLDAEAGPGVDRLRQCVSHPCAHLRTGIYRNPTIRGDSVVYVDGTTVAKTRAAAEAGAGVSRGD